jgi:shikimate 5-dehydrogenase
MKKFGLIGNPVKGSRSPLLFNAAYRDARQEDGAEYAYDLIEEDEFEAAWEKFLNEYHAVNITAPFKELAYAKMLELSKEGKGFISGPAARIGATNLVVKTGKGIEAYNSDFTGIIMAVAEAYYPGIVEEFIREFGSRFYIKVHQFFKMNIEAKFGQIPQALIVGCGGAGKAAAIAAAEMGFGTVLMNRTLEKARDIAAKYPSYGFIPDPLTDFKEALKECDLIIYTLPVALPEIAELAADDFAMEKGRKVILEANYRNPSFDDDTQFKIASADSTYIHGHRWLLYQALTGYSLMTGLQPNLAAMEEAMKAI